MASPSDFAFTLTGTPVDIKYALGEIRRQQENPYDSRARFRLEGVDEEGVKWSGGYTTPSIDPGDTDWAFCGSINSLSTDDDGEMVSRNAGTELIFRMPRDSQMAFAMGRFVQTDQPGGAPSREHVMEALGSRIRFAYEPSSEALSIAASRSTDLPLTYTENWLGEPLRILFGQLVFPRLVARNFGDGRALVWVRRSPDFIRAAGWAALWGGDYRALDRATFWSLYEGLLSLVAGSRGKDGSPNFESHKITRLYEEIIQTARGSRWVWAMTFASSIEGLVKMLIPKDAKPSQAETDAITCLVTHIKAWPGDGRLKQIAANAVHRTAEITTIRALRELSAAGVVTEVQLSAWQKIRNAVMHGKLVSPYSSEEEDTQLLALAGMMHALTREILSRSVAGPGKSPHDPQV